MGSCLKKILAVLALSALLLTGCGESGPKLDPQNPTSVMVWHYYNGKQKEAFDALVSQFNETTGAEKGIVVVAESKGNVEDLAKAVVDSADKTVGAAELPALFATYVDTAYVLYEKGALADISGYFTAEELKEYVPSYIEEGRLAEGQLQVFPIAKSTELLYVNLTDWEPFAAATGVKLSDLSTWEGLAQVAGQYYEWSEGKALFGRDAFANYLLVGSRQLGKELFLAKNGQVTFQLDETVMRRLWDGYAVPFLKGWYGAYGRFRSDDVKTGDLVACVGSTPSVSYYPSEVTRQDGSTYPIEAAVLPLPSFEGTEPYAVQQGAGMAVVKADPLQEQAAVEFLKWFTDEKQNLQFSVDSGYFPVKIQASSQQSMESALLVAGQQPGSLVYQSALLGAEATQSAHLYTNKPFTGGTSARDVLTKYMTTVLEEYREQYQQAAAGEQAPLLEELFASWLSSLEQELKAA